MLTFRVLKFRWRNPERKPNYWICHPSLLCSSPGVWRWVSWQSWLSSACSCSSSCQPASQLTACRFASPPTHQLSLIPDPIHVLLIWLLPLYLSLLLCSCAPVLMCSCAYVLLFFCAAVLLFSCAPVLVWSCSPVLLFSCAPVLLCSSPAASNTFSWLSLACRLGTQ